MRPGLKSTVAPTLNLWPDIPLLRLARTHTARAPRTLPLHAGAPPAIAESAHSITFSRPILRFLDLACLLAAAAPIVFKHERDPISLIDRADSGLLQCSGMDEHILAAVLGLDETITLGCIEKFHRTSDAHVGIPFPKEAWIGRSCIGPHARPLHLRRGKANRPLGKQQNRNLEDVPSKGHTGCAGIWGRIGAEARLIVPAQAPRAKPVNCYKTCGKGADFSVGAGRRPPGRPSARPLARRTASAPARDGTGATVPRGRRLLPSGARRPFRWSQALPKRSVRPPAASPPRLLTGDGDREMSRRR